jgi:hypothetical protein
MMTAIEVRKRMIEYGLSADVVGHFADTSGATISKWTRNLADISEETQERISTAVKAMMNMSRHFDGLPIRWSETAVLQPIVDRFIRELRESPVATLKNLPAANQR